MRCVYDKLTIKLAINKFELVVSYTIELTLIRFSACIIMYVISATMGEMLNFFLVRLSFSRHYNSVDKWRET